MSKRKTSQPRRVHPTNVQTRTRISRAKNLSIIIAIFVIITGLISYACYSAARANSKIIAELQSYSDRNSGSTYDEFIANYFNNPLDIEIIALFDQKGNKLIECTGDEGSVSIPEEAIPLICQLDHVTHVHTHPKFAGIDDYPHSDRDIVMPIITGMGNHIDTLVVLCGNHIYELDRNNSKWLTPPDMLNILGDIAYPYVCDVPEDASEHDWDQKLIDAGWYTEVITDGASNLVTTPKLIENISDIAGYTFRSRTFNPEGST